MARTESPLAPSSPIAIVGMACRFPKAPDLRSYWRNLREGVDAVGPIPKSHWSAQDYFDPDPKRPDFTYAKRGAFLEATPFYPLEFGISPRDIEATDTTQLFAMLAAREAMWDAGYAGPKAKAFDRSKTSVMLGVTGSLELVIPLGARLSHPHWRRALEASGVEESVIQEVIERMSSGYVPWQENSFPGLLGNVAAGRIANRLDLHGTNCVVDAACASSLSALHLACLELQSGRADMALSGGVDTFNDIFMYMCFSKTPALSKSGDARPFSKEADGTILGEGVGVVVLKRLEDAKRDQDHIYAVISGIGTSSDGKGHAVYAPSSDGQRRCLADAYRQSELSPSQVELVEAHGTGTPVGDGIELDALVSTFKEDAQGDTQEELEPWCAVGSVKSMIGHTKAAAGIAGLMKCALALQARVLPPTIKADRPHAKLEASGPLYLNQRPRPWIRQDPSTPRRAGVSAFGFGGSNFHCLLEQSPQAKDAPAFEVDADLQLLAMSAPDAPALMKALALVGDSQDKSQLRCALAKAREDWDRDEAWSITHVLDLEAWAQDPKAYAKKLLAAVETPESADEWTFVRSVAKKAPKISLCFGELTQTSPSPLFLWSNAAVEVAELLLAGQSPSQVRAWWAGQAQDGKGAWANLVAYAQLLRGLKLQFAAPRKGQKRSALHRALGDFVSGKLGLAALVKRLENADTPAQARLDLSDDEVVLGLSARGVWFGGLSHEPASLSGEVQQDQRAWVRLAAQLLDAGALLPQQGWDLEAESDRLAQAGRGMAVSIVGANAKPKPSELPPRPKNSVRVHDANAPATIPPFEGLDMSKSSLPVEPARPSDAPIQTAQDAFAATQSQIEALLALQEQSARLHQQFLESQEATLLRYQELIARQQSLVAAQLGVEVPVAAATPAGHAVAGAFVQGSQQAAPLPRPSARPAISAAAAAFAGLSAAPASGPGPGAGPASGLVSEVVAAADAPAVAAASAPAQDAPSSPEPSAGVSNLRTSLYAIVSDKTGYPKDILEPEMRLDEDLGIDSIKRVEIGSALSEKISGLESMDAQDLHGMDTLQAWEDALLAQLDQGAQSDAAPVSTGSVEDVSEQAGVSAQPATAMGLAPAQLRRAILEVVADKTGYPHASLEWEMRLDEDLGIDSIKRVEIFSSLQERGGLTELPEADELAQLDTLEAVYDALLEKAEQPASAEPVASAPVGPSSASAGHSHASMMALLVEVVADKTGYPKEMIEPTMELDQELGIDSIKRVEILSALTEREPAASNLDAQELAEMRDLDSLCKALLEHMGQGGESEAPSAAQVTDTATQDSEPAKVVTKEAVSGSPDAKAPQRFLTSPRAWTPGKETGPSLNELVPAGASFWMLGAPKEPVSMALEQALQDQGYRVHVVTSPKEAADLPLPAGMIMVAPPWHVDSAYLASVMGVLTAFGRARKSEEVRGGVLLGVTQMNGSFGLGEFPVDADPLLGGVVGMVKTAAREWPSMRVMACDLESGWTDADEIAVALLEQLDKAGPVERGLGRDGEVRELVVQAQPLSDKVPSDASLVPGVEFGEEDLALVSAGARGVTAKAALALARKGLKHFVLLGRSKAMLEEPSWIQGVEGEARMKSMIASKASQKLHPKRLEARYREILAGREIRKQLQALEALGAKAQYLSADLRDAEALGAALEQASVDPGKVSVLVHGAGVLADGRIEDKRPEDFSSVYGTKVEGLANLLAWCDASPLRAIALFSSSTARFGRTGQVDYAAANEVLNKIAARQAQVRPHCRVASINWGPWDGGMVSPGLKKQFASEGIFVLEAQAASEHLAAELAAPQHSVESVVLGEGSKIEPVFVGQGEAAQPRARLLVETAAQRSEPEIILPTQPASPEPKPELDREVVPEVASEAARQAKSAVASKAEQGPSFLASLAAQHTGGLKPSTAASAAPRPAAPRQRNRATLSAAGKAVWKRSVSLKTDPYLREHAFATRAVVPAAWMVEWMAQAAARLESSLHLVGVDDFQVLRGVRLTEDEVCDLRVVVGRIDNRGDQRILQMHIASGPDVPGQSTLHGRARVVLADHPQSKLESLERFPTLRSDDLWDLHKDDIYDLGLFHEGSFRLLGEIRGNRKQPDLVLGSLQSGLGEDRWQGLGKVGDWLIHPEIMDAAFQMMIVWSLKTQGEASLPTSFGRYRQLADFDPKAVKLAVHVRRRAPRRATADIIWRDVKGRIVATMRDFSCVMDPALREAFARREVGPTPPPVDLPAKVVTP